MSIDFEIEGTLQPYLEKMISNLPNGPKLVMQALSKKDYNKEDLSLKARVRRGELNFAVCWLEALGFAEFNSSGRQKLYSLTPLGLAAFEKFNELFMDITEDEDAD
ncbi:hypothetical protein I8J29_16480 [Paenibacillus sp. MWE-103]|uniref:Transcriptional regulator n=1 Tax=Paenibacillus artemisiicola TaxID=1172618 RepID=A0ABS3WBX8_9BACL|nr:MULTISPECIES: hypothetical protein [Paenibacillus]MBO7745806.1 hypothetical protein [Paenibacillus artemisiicola]SFJ77148.1 hypothetical protein SAMN02799624_05902 [Paenibacillus sp. UNC496MF]